MHWSSKLSEPEDDRDRDTRVTPARRGPSLKGQLVSQYGLWIGAAATFSVAAGWFFPDGQPTQIPLPAILVALFGFGIWPAVLNKLNERGEGWAADILFGVFVSIVLFKWGFLAGMILRGNLG